MSKESDAYQAGREVGQKEAAMSYEQRIAELEAEVTEQARLLGMSSEREARLLARIAEIEAQSSQEAESDRVCHESDGCPTETAVLQREWRSNRERIAELEAERSELYRIAVLSRKTLNRWMDKYADNRPQWLPPANSVQLLEAIDAALAAKEKS